MFFKKTDYEVVSEQDGEFTVRIKGKKGQTVTVDKAVGEVILDLNNDQYNSDHTFYRYQDLFFKVPSYRNGVEINPFDDLVDGSQIKVTSTYSQEPLLDRLIEEEDAAEQAHLLSKALATLTEKQRHAIEHFFFMGEKQNVIAKQMHISPMMVHKHLEAAQRKLRTFYETYTEK